MSSKATEHKQKFYLHGTMENRKNNF